MTKKEKLAIEQKAVNEKCQKFIDMAKNLNWFAFEYRAKKLYNCNAKYVIDDKEGRVWLKSYDTIVAVIEDGVCYDFLRVVYGYTATSCQHINKFYHKFGAREFLVAR